MLIGRLQKHVPVGHADWTAPIRQPQLYRSYSIRNTSDLKNLDMAAGRDDLDRDHDLSNGA